MKKVLKWFGVVIVGIVILTAAFVGIYAPLRARSLAERYAQFRTDFQPMHDTIDAEFNHQDRVSSLDKFF